MRVTLAVAYNGNNGGDTVDLPRPEARNLITRGKARVANEMAPEQDEVPPHLDLNFDFKDV